MSGKRLTVEGGSAARGSGGGRRSRRLLCALFATFLLLLAVAAPSSALTVGVGWTGIPAQIGAEMLQVGRSGAEAFRLPLPPQNNNDGAVQDAAENNATILAEIGTGGSTLPQGGDLTTYLNQVYNEVRRYGHGGQFWSEHPWLPYKPITAWEVGNEPNLAGIDPEQYGVFLKEAAAAIQNGSRDQAGRTTDVLFGGLLVWGTENEAEAKARGRSPKTSYQGARRYLATAYGSIKSDPNVTGIAIHPYAVDPDTFKGSSRIGAFQSQVSGFHAELVSLAAGGTQKVLWITETGWPAEGNQYSVGQAEQANLLKSAIGWTRGAAGALNLGGFLWYNLRDTEPVDKWQNRSGLIAGDGSYRPAWFAFQEEMGARKWPDPADPLNIAAMDTGSATNVYTGATNGHLYQKACCFGSEGWTSWFDMGSPPGGMQSGPAAQQTGAATNVYVASENGHLYQKSCCTAPEGWGSWFDMGSPPGAVATDPAAVFIGSATNVYVGSTDGHLYQKSCCTAPEGWGSWFDMGSPPGGMQTAPAAVYIGSATNVYVGSKNGHLYQKACCFGSEGWTAWWDMGNPPPSGIATGPAAVYTGSATNVYVGGGNGHVYQKSCCFGTEGWSNWFDLGSTPSGGATSSPATVQTSAGFTNVYARGPNTHIYQRACCFPPEGWNPWWDMGSPP